MKKIIVALGVALVVALAGFSLAGPAAATDYRPSDTEQDTSPGSLGSGTSQGADDASAGSLPATGGPETALLIGGAALLAVGGTALVVARRRSA